MRARLWFHLSAAERGRDCLFGREGDRCLAFTYLYLFEKERERDCAYVCGCVDWRERERETVPMCVGVLIGERERERESVCRLQSVYICHILLVAI